MDIEGTMQFILDQQARFSSDVARIVAILGNQAERLSKLEEISQRSDERQFTFEKTMERLAERQSDTEQTILERQRKTEQTILEVGQTLLDVANAQERTNRILATLAERQVETEKVSEEARRATEEAMRGLVERQKITEENLNVLLLTVERHISKHK
jgi:hypothetical protein